MINLHLEQVSNSKVFSYFSEQLTKIMQVEYMLNAVLEMHPCSYYGCKFNGNRKEPDAVIVQQAIATLSLCSIINIRSRSKEACHYGQTEGCCDGSWQPELLSGKKSVNTP